MTWLRRNCNRQLVAFLLVSGAMAFGLKLNADAGANTLYKAQISSCIRANGLRKENNLRVKSHLAERDVLAEFITSAENARLHTFHVTHDPAEKHTAKEYASFVKRLKKEVTFNKVKLVTCRIVIPEP